MFLLLFAACADLNDTGAPPDGLTTRVTATESNIATLYATSDATVADVAEHERRLDDHDAEFTEQANLLNNHENRLMKLENKNESHDEIERDLQAQIDALTARVEALEAAAAE